MIDLFSSSECSDYWIWNLSVHSTHTTSWLHNNSDIALFTPINTPLVLSEPVGSCSAICIFLQSPSNNDESMIEWLTITVSSWVNASCIKLERLSYSKANDDRVNSNLRLDELRISVWNRSIVTFGFGSCANGTGRRCPAVIQLAFVGVGTLCSQLVHHHVLVGVCHVPTVASQIVKGLVNWAVDDLLLGVIRSSLYELIYHNLRFICTNCRECIATTTLSLILDTSNFALW